MKKTAVLLLLCACSTKDAPPPPSASPHQTPSLDAGPNRWQGRYKFVWTKGAASAEYTVLVDPSDAGYRVELKAEGTQLVAHMIGRGAPNAHELSVSLETCGDDDMRKCEPYKTSDLLFALVNKGGVISMRFEKMTDPSGGKGELKETK